MKEDMLKNFLLIGRVQNAISKASTLDEALQQSLRIIVEGCNADYAVVWMKNASKSDEIRPFYWLCPNDITSKAHMFGEGYIGRVCSDQQAIRLLEVAPDDAELNTDFTNLGICSMVCAPLLDGADTLGCVQILSSSQTFSEEEADACEILTMMASMSLSESDRLLGSIESKPVILKARGVTRSFQNGDTITKVLRGMNLDVYEGEFLAILGESGCGKTTFLNILGGMDQLDDGQLLYLDQDLSHASQDELTDYRRYNIGFIFQSYNLMPNLNAEQNLQLIAELVDDPMNSVEALDLVGLSERKKNYPSQLSGGQQQRVSIARALVKNPRIIFADEPTAALDFETSIEVLRVLEEVVNTGTTLVMVTHNEEITRMAHRVVRMRHGRIHEVVVNRHPAQASDLEW